MQTPLPSCRPCCHLVHGVSQAVKSSVLSARSSGAPGSLLPIHAKEPHERGQVSKQVPAPAPEPGPGPVLALVLVLVLVLMLVPKTVSLHSNVQPQQQEESPQPGGLCWWWGYP